jgi:purine-binding chemotaxis protein CheW
MDRIIELAETAIEPVPPVLQRGAGDAEIDAIGRLDGGRSLVAILSPEKLFGNRIIAAAFSSLEQKETSMQERGEEASAEQFVVLDLGDERYGLPIAAVDEIVQLPDAITRLPKAPAFVAGVINLRGTPLPVIDQRRRFEARPSTAAGRRARVVVVTVDGLRAGFIVDGVSEILSLPPELVRPAPALPGDDAKVFDRVAPIGSGGDMLLLVDPRQLLDRAERDLLAALKLADRSAAS